VCIADGTSRPRSAATAMQSGSIVAESSAATSTCFGVAGISIAPQRITMVFHDSSLRASSESGRAQVFSSPTPMALSTMKMRPACAWMHGGCAEKRR
jgi:hypothetical protein